MQTREESTINLDTQPLSREAAELVVLAALILMALTWVIFSVTFLVIFSVAEEAEETAEKGPEADTQSQQESGEVSVSDEDIADGMDSDMEI